MKNRYLVTGAAGHLGLTVTRMLLERGETVRVLVLPADATAAQLPEGVEVMTGDIRDSASIEPCFATAADEALTVIHCAGIVTIASRYDPNVYDVNVNGTRNIVDLCLRHGVRKLVYVSSVHAIPPLPHGETIREIEHFDPAKVKGLYAQTKAEATALVLAAARERGLNASVVHPSGICGPDDYSNGHLTQLIRDWHDGGLTAGIQGGYDFVDVRDVAGGILACEERGRSGECYLLTNQYISVREIFDSLHRLGGRRHIRRFLPLWFIRLMAPMAELYYRILRQKPLFTAYSIYTLESNAVFSHDKATRELGYTTRPFDDTLRDTLTWCEKACRFKKA